MSNGEWSTILGLLLHYLYFDDALSRLQTGVFLLDLALVYCLWSLE